MIRNGIILLIVSLCLFVARFAIGAEAPAGCVAGSVCVDPAEQAALTKVLQEKKCLLTDKPQFQLDPIAVVVDDQGRIYGTGAEPHPYTVKMHWCSYDVTAIGDVKLQVAIKEPPTWGWRFRAKATLGVLFVNLVTADTWTKGIDGGLLLEPFYIKWLNFNLYVGVRSIGGGVGFDLTKNFGLFAGAAVSYDGWKLNPLVSAYFAF